MGLIQKLFGQKELKFSVENFTPWLNQQIKKKERPFIIKVNEIKVEILQEVKIAETKIPKLSNISTVSTDEKVNTILNTNKGEYFNKLNLFFSDVRQIKNLPVREYYGRFDSSFRNFAISSEKNISVVEQIGSKDISGILMHVENIAKKLKAIKQITQDEYFVVINNLREKEIELLEKDKELRLLKEKLVIVRDLINKENEAITDLESTKDGLKQNKDYQFIKGLLETQKEVEEELKIVNNAVIEKVRKLEHALRKLSKNFPNEWIEFYLKDPATAFAKDEKDNLEKILAELHNNKEVIEIDEKTKVKIEDEYFTKIHTKELRNQFKNLKFRWNEIRNKLLSYDIIEKIASLDKNLDEKKRSLAILSKRERKITKKIKNMNIRDSINVLEKLCYKLTNQKIVIEN